MTVSERQAALNALFSTWGACVADAANQRLRGASDDETLASVLQYFTDRRRDLLRPTLVRLACRAMQGTPDHATPAAVAMILTSYYLGLIDDIIDQSHVKLFRPTLLQRFGVNQSLLVATLCWTQAHRAIADLRDHVDGATYQRILDVFTTFPITMVEGEQLNVIVKQHGIVPSDQLLHVLAQHAADIAACTEIGALVGGASTAVARRFQEFGQHLGILLLLNDDNRAALNYSLNLDVKLLTQAYPYPVLWAANRAPRFRRLLETLRERSALTPEEVATCVHTLETVGALRHVKALMVTHAQEAASTLSSLPRTEARDLLIELALAQPELVVD